MKKALTICTLISALCGVRMASGQATPKLYTDAEAYAVYSVVLESEWPIREAKAKKLVIETETVDYPTYGDDKMDCLVSAKGEESIYDPVIAAYHEVNKVRWLLQPKFDASVSYQLVSSASIKAFFKGKGATGWTGFYAKYPDSDEVISMSAVGFNADKTIAVVYLGYSCGGLCGAGTYHFLRKTEDKWSEFKWKGMSCRWAS